MSEHFDRFDAPIEMRFIDLFMIIIASLLFIIMTLGIAASRTEVPLRIETDSLPAAILNEDFDLALARSGGKAPFTWRTSDGTLPAGLELKDGHIKGRPHALGESRFTIELTDARLHTDRLTLTLEVRAITPQSVENQPWVTVSKLVLPDSRVEEYFSAKLQAAGGLPPYRWELREGHLPAGLSLDSQGSLSGTPPDYLLMLYSRTAIERQFEMRQKATYEFTVAATDSAGAKVSQSVQLYMEPLPAPFWMQFLANDFNEPVNRLVWFLSLVTWCVLLILAWVIVFSILVAIVNVIRIGATPTYLFLAGYREQRVAGWYGLFHRRRSEPSDADYQLSPLLAPYAMTLHRAVELIRRVIGRLLSKLRRREPWKRVEEKSDSDSREDISSVNDFSPLGPLETLKAILKFLLSFFVLFGKDERLKEPEDEDGEGEEEEQLPELPEGPPGIPGFPGGGMATGMISNPANEMVRHQLTKEEEEYMEALRKGARVKYGGAYLAVAFLQAIQFEKTVNQVFSPLAKVGNGLLHTSLDKFLQELLSLRGKDISFGKIDSRFDVILGRRAPAPKSMFGRRKSEKNNPMLLQLVLPTELQSNNQAARELSKTMRNSAEQALSWMLDTLPKNDRSVLGNPKMLKRVLRKQAYIQLIDGVLHVRLILLKQKATRKFAEALCGALNAKNPHTLGRLKFPLRIAVGSSSPWY